LADGSEPFAGESLGQQIQVGGDMADVYRMIGD
jgi:hypothetical protein